MRLLRARLRAVQALDLQRIRQLHVRHPGLRIDLRAASAFAVSEYRLEAGSRLEIAAGAVTERRRGGVRFHLGPGSSLRVGPGSWLRSDIENVRLVTFEGARLEIGPDAFLNGCHLSAKCELVLGRRAWVGPGSRIFDADQHDLDADRPEGRAPVHIGDHVWIASDVTVMKGVSIGAHSIIGARSVVTRSIPAHSFAAGAPAQVLGEVGDRSRAR